MERGFTPAGRNPWLSDVPEHPRWGKLDTCAAEETPGHAIDGHSIAEQTPSALAVD